MEHRDSFQSFFSATVNFIELIAITIRSIVLADFLLTLNELTDDQKTSLPSLKPRFD